MLCYRMCTSPLSLSLSLSLSLFLSFSLSLFLSFSFSFSCVSFSFSFSCVSFSSNIFERTKSLSRLFAHAPLVPLQQFSPSKRSAGKDIPPPSLYSVAVEIKKQKQKQKHVPFSKGARLKQPKYWALSFYITNNHRFILVTHTHTHNLANTHTLT